jgi:hypothetical protein
MDDWPTIQTSAEKRFYYWLEEKLVFSHSAYLSMLLPRNAILIA